jgi:Secretion system C-terminal sorting domain
MKKLVLICFVCLMVNAYAQSTAFSKLLSNAQNLDVNLISSAPTLDFGSLIVGKTSNAKGLITKLDSLGNTVWTKSITRNQTVFINLEFQQIIATKDSAFLVIGFAKVNALSKKMGICIKLDQNGDSIWSKQISIPNYDVSFNSVIEAFGDKYVILGTGDSITNTYSASRPYFLELNQNGNLLISKVYQNNINISGNSIKQCEDSSYLIAGNSTNFGYLMKISSTGSTNWIREYTIPLPTSPNNKFTIHGLEVINNNYFFNAHWGSTITLVKVDQSGQVVAAYSGYGNPMLSNNPMLKTNDMHLIFTYAEPIPPLYTVNKNGLIKVDTNGNMIWKNEIDATIFGLHETNANEIVMCGLNDEYIYNFNRYYKKSTILKSNNNLSNLNCIQNVNSNSVANSPQLIQDFIVTSNVTPISSGTINNFNLIITSLSINATDNCLLSSGKNHFAQNDFTIYPNPSSNVFKLHLNNYELSYIRLFNTFGQIVLEKKISNTETPINMESYPKGIYQFQIISNNHSTTHGKLILE